ncbi:gluconate:H+ symporter [Streptomyces sp. DSM 44915]|uniref:Gluconate:H+ symporter n=1 Tax=Streptomyces chisholmiae TaxID=3075540 RepID=A0ABU2JVR9_9ACTN|nr:gluconate:H+ symporter [Streptomyces sp. DSM 44915]MDT0269082.1 gluconate:H+ symporter [Streptomyces sp. DSM 44915]
MDNTTWTLVAALAAVGLLLLMVIRWKFQEFLALLVTTIVFGLAVGTSPTELVELVVEEMGGSLGQLALVISLGAVFGTILQRAGAAERIATTLVGKFSDKNIAWGLGVAGFLVSISVYIDVAIVILVPMLYGIAQRTGKSLLYYGIPMCAGLSCAYTFMPPAPGPLAAAGIMDAELGLVILFGVLCGIPAVTVAGPLFGRYIAKRIFVPVPTQLHAEATGIGGTAGGGTSSDAAGVESPRGASLPSFRSVVGALLLPLALIVLGTVGKQALQEGTAPANTLMFIGHPVIALLLTCLYTMYFFGVRRGATGEELRELASSALGPAGQIILITGAGGAFGGVLVASGLGEVLAEAMEDASVPLVVFGFLTASVIRICQGSGMIAMITGATFTAPLAQALGAGPTETALTTIAIACGGAAFSHVNDSGFWMANRYFGMSVADTLRSWTVMKTTVGVTGFAAVLALSAFTS